MRVYDYLEIVYLSHLYVYYLKKDILYDKVQSYLFMLIDIGNEKIFLLELIEKLKEMLSRYCLHSDVSLADFLLLHRI